MEHASGWRHGGGPAAGLAASRHPRRHRQQLHRCSGGLRQRAAPCLAGVPLQAQMLAAWRRPPRGVPVRPKCLGVIHSGRPFQARDAYDGCSRVRRPSGEPGLRVVARVDLCIAREKASFYSSQTWGWWGFFSKQRQILTRQISVHTGKFLEDFRKHGRAVPAPSRSPHRQIFEIFSGGSPGLSTLLFD